MNHWIFLGNPTVFDVNNEITERPDRLYWSPGKFSRKIVPGDRVFVWRSTVDPGVIAIGEVTGYPTSQQDLPEDVPHDDSTDLKVPLQLWETRLTQDDGMVSRNTVVNDEILSPASIVKANTGSVHRLTPEQAAQLALLWNAHTGFAYPLDGEAEGARKLRVNYSRERSSNLRKQKIDDVKSTHGSVSCEVCGATAPDWVHPAVGERMFEVHHRRSISLENGPVATTLNDLAVLCANCHRMVHTTTSVVAMCDLLQDGFEDASVLSAADHEEVTIHPRKLYEYHASLGDAEYEGLAIGMHRTDTGIVFHDTDRDRIFEGTVRTRPQEILVESKGMTTAFRVVDIERFYSYWVPRIGGNLPMFPDTRTLHRWYYTQFIQNIPWVEPAYT